MKRSLIVSLALGLLVWKSTHATWVAEQEGAAYSAQTLPTGSSPAQSAAIATGPSASMFPPEVVTADCTVKTLDRKSNSPNLLLLTAGGKELMVFLDPKITSVVWGNGWKMRLDKFMLGPEPNRLRMGSHVEVSHILKSDGERVTTIQILGGRPIRSMFATL